jgi:uncharacterized protein (TIGR03905 family)
MKKITYRPHGVCPAEISFDLDGDTVHNVRFLGGCPGNLKAISKVTEGWTVAQIVEMFRGNTCGNKPTSCVDQLAAAVQEAYEKENA